MWWGERAVISSNVVYFPETGRANVFYSLNPSSNSSIQTFWFSLKKTCHTFEPVHVTVDATTVKEVLTFSGKAFFTQTCIIVSKTEEMYSANVASTLSLMMYLKISLINQASALSQWIWIKLIYFFTLADLIILSSSWGKWTLFSEHFQTEFRRQVYWEVKREREFSQYSHENISLIMSTCIDVKAKGME